MRKSGPVAIFGIDEDGFASFVAVADLHCEVLGGLGSLDAVLSMKCDFFVIVPAGYLQRGHVVVNKDPVVGDPRSISTRSSRPRSAASMNAVLPYL